MPTPEAPPLPSSAGQRQTVSSAAKIEKHCVPGRLFFYLEGHCDEPQTNDPEAESKGRDSEKEHKGSTPILSALYVNSSTMLLSPVISAMHYLRSAASMRMGRGVLS